MTWGNLATTEGRPVRSWGGMSMNTVLWWMQTEEEARLDCFLFSFCGWVTVSSACKISSLCSCDPSKRST